MFQSSPLFEANYKSTADVVINQGGSSSGKTYSILQVLFVKALELPKQVVTIVGQDLPNLKVGALRDAAEIVDSSEAIKSNIRSYNKSNLVYELFNGSILEFKSYADLQDAKSGKRDYLFVNEANGVSFPIFTQLQLRTKKQTFIDYNPNSEFWVHENLIGKKNVHVIISDHRHNPFCTQKIREKLEALKDIDRDLWLVYARGKTGKVMGLVFRNWTVCDDLPRDASGNITAKLVAHGMDFGFTNDPSTIVSVYKQEGKLWIDERLYRTEMTNNDISSYMKFLPINKSEPVVADSAEPKSIKEIQLAGFRIEPALKGPDSIKSGIDILKRYQIMVTVSSINLRKELGTYKWAEDKDGKSLNVPVDYANHCIDAVRYVALNKLNNRPSGKYATMSI